MSLRARHGVERPTLIAALVTLAAAAPVYWITLSLSEQLLFADTETKPVAAMEAAASEPARPVAPSAPAPGAAVTGTLRTAEGTPVPGEIVELFSRSLEAGFFAASDAHGRFEIPDVTPGSDYEARVSPQGAYRDYAQSGIPVSPEGAALDLVLESLGAARLAGRMVDAEGVPLPQRTLLLEAGDRAAQLVTGDERGHFLVEHAPTGPLTFTSRTTPHVEVRGPTLEPASDAELLLVLDEGRHQLSGRVVDERDAPLSEAQLELSWTHEEGGAISRSARTAVSDRDGAFRFTDLGPGPHQLDVRAEGYAASQAIFGVSGNLDDVEMRLQPD